MIEINNEEKDNLTVESRLVQLNQVLSGVRSHLEHSAKERSEIEQKFDDLRLSVFELSSQAKESSKEQDELISVWQDRIVQLENLYAEGVSGKNVSQEELEAKLNLLNHTLNEIRTKLETVQLDDKEELIKSLPFAQFESKIQSIQEHYGSLEKHVYETDERQNMHFVRLQQLEVSREEILSKTRELWSLNNEYKGVVQDQEGRLDFLDKERTEIKYKMDELEQCIHQKLDQESQAWKESRDEFHGLHAKFEAFHRELALGVSQAFEQGQNLQMEQERLEQSKVARHEVEKLESQFKDIQQQQTQFEEQAQSTQMGHEILIDGIKVEVMALNEKVEEVKKQFENEVEQRSQNLNKELVLARDSQFDQHQKVQQEIDKIKQQQREIGNLKENIEAKEKESKELRHEIRILKNEMGGLYRQLRQQRTVAFTAIAAAILMSVGLSYIISPASSVSSENVAAMYQPIAHMMDEDSVDLEAPKVEVIEIYDDKQLLGAEDNDLFKTTNNEAIEQEEMVKESLVAPAFNKVEDTQAQMTSKFVEYIVREGDSLWAIAKKHKGQGELMERIEKIKRDNQLQTPQIKRGQVLRIFL